MDQRTAFLNRIGTATPGHDIHHAFIRWAESQIRDRHQAALFRRMAARSGIAHRWSVLPPTETGGSPVEPGGFYSAPILPTTAARMALYAEAAPDLALKAIAGLGTLDAISHLVVASCTGFVAPGIDQIIAARLGLSGSIERTLVGFMGCYAAVAALRVAHHIVRSEPAARVLVVTVELSSLHLRPVQAIEPLLAMLQFGDGAAAALVTAEPRGLAMRNFFAATLPDSAGLIRWTIGDEGFAMHLSGEVPGRIGQALAEPELREMLLGQGTVDGWAVHAGGRSILDAVEAGLGLGEDALAASRAVLDACGNMSSATLMFVLARMLREKPPRNGVAVAFGPGLAAEGFRFGGAR
ncbi:type III polyketide synthase [Sphingomonas oleivorans]|uniref:Type III polyketide synthase n=1 Tax=Sphingomonas oleivorans TaxID=1735121 RepID=A0A2T5G2R7_9SPHN|nr:type III polyketide synthase [Sphingomonas oleivorans]PTQ13437.1 type III polyketide synthase [Sphingomonas oleivorans]